MMKTAVYSYSTDNIGDEVQSIAAMRLLPRVDTLMERDRLSLAPREPTFLIANGWYLHSRDFPPPPQVRPFYIAFHAAHDLALTPQAIEHLKLHGPVGCRDVFTLERLKSCGVPAYFSGCLTTTLEASPDPLLREGVVLVDVDPDLGKSIPAHLTSDAIALTQHSGTSIDPIRHEARILAMIEHRHFPARPLGRMFYTSLISLRQKIHLPQRVVRDRFQRAEHLLSRYEKARLVITSRLHCALPCIAIGTPVILLHKNPQDPRFGALNGYLKIHAEKDLAEIDWNPGAVRSDRMQRHIIFLREAVEKAIVRKANPFRDCSDSDLQKMTSSFMQSD